MRATGPCRSTLRRGGVLQSAPHFVEVVVGQLGGQVIAALFQRGVDLEGVGVPQILQVLSSVVRGHVHLRLLSAGLGSADVRRVAEPRTTATASLVTMTLSARGGHLPSDVRRRCGASLVVLPAEGGRRPPAGRP
jgi:hypothetical protein